MRAIWENDFRQLIQAVYTEDRGFVRLYGQTFWQGVVNSLKMAVEKVSEAVRVYRIEDDLGVIAGFAMIDHAVPAIVEAHIRPSQQLRAFEFYTVVDDLMRTGDNYQSYIIRDCAVNSCAFIQATQTCNSLPLEFRVHNGVLQYRYTWSNHWISILDILSAPPPAGPRIELRKLGTWIQWRQTGDANWYNLYDIQEFSGEEYEDIRIPVTALGQTVFTLPEVISEQDKHTTLLFVNGQKRYYPQDYTIVGTTLTWVDTDFKLKPTFEVDLFYKKP